MHTHQQVGHSRTFGFLALLGFLASKPCRPRSTPPCMMLMPPPTTRALSTASAAPTYPWVPGSRR